MRALANGGPAAADTTAEPTRALLDEIKVSLADLDRYAIGDMTEEVELAELIGKLRALTNLLVAIADR